MLYIFWYIYFIRLLLYRSCLYVFFILPYVTCVPIHIYLYFIMHIMSAVYILLICQVPKKLWKNLPFGSWVYIIT